MNLPNTNTNTIPVGHVLRVSIYKPLLNNNEMVWLVVLVGGEIPKSVQFLPFFLGLDGAMIIGPAIYYNTDAHYIYYKI